MPRAFRLRGIVEGFYGPPWSHAARREVLSFVAKLRMNAYVYAPKDDPYHRTRWREPYPADEQAALGALAAHCRDVGVRFGFAISPGLDTAYESDADRKQLDAKLAPLIDAGVDWFILALDDIPAAPGLAARQAELATWLHDRVGEQRPGAAITVCPTEYVGTRPSPYLAELARDLPAAVSLLWTGPTVCSPTITATDAESWTAAVAPHEVVLWDNYPVNDGTMTTRLHLGPYDGREPALADMLGGVLLNPMVQAHASLVALATAARFLADPDDYEPQPAWADAIHDVGREHALLPVASACGSPACDELIAPAAAALRALPVASACGPPASGELIARAAAALHILAEACADGPVRSPADLELARLVDALDARIDGADWITPAREVCAVLRAARDVPDTLTENTAGALAAEVAPWAAAAAREAAAGLAAIRVLQRCRPVAVVDSAGRGQAAAPDAELLVEAVFGLVFSWSGARANVEVTFGPRFAIYPAVVQTESGRPAVAIDLAVIEDANAIDRLCRLALREYERWRVAADETVTALVGGVERPIAPDGSFDATGGTTLVRSGRLATQVGPDEALPVRDRRLQ